MMISKKKKSAKNLEFLLAKGESFSDMYTFCKSFITTEIFISLTPRQLLSRRIIHSPFKLFGWGIIFLFSLTLLLAADKDKADWTHYARVGLTHDYDINGGHIYYRVKRVTSNTFRDLRLFGYELGEESYIYLRYKGSYKYSNIGKLYNFSTVAYQKNTRAGLNLRYHFNQGLGYFLSDYKSGHINCELGQAYDMSDYLNDTRKTSYIKGGIYWDHSMKSMEIKLESEWFKQISEIVEADLSRYQFFSEASYELNKHLSLIFGFEQDYYTAGVTHPQSYYLSLGWKR